MQFKTIFGKDIAKPSPPARLEPSTMKALLRNKKATFNYEIIEKFVAGIVLHGFEVKSLKAGRGSFEGSYVIEQGGELYLKNFFIPPYQPKNTPESYEPERLRKLLLNKKEIDDLADKRKSDRLTIVPLALYNAGHRLKLEIGLARGKKRHDKRETIKKRDTERDLGRTLKG